MKRIYKEVATGEIKQCICYESLQKSKTYLSSTVVLNLSVSNCWTCTYVYKNRCVPGTLQLGNRTAGQAGSLDIMKKKIISG